MQKIVTPERLFFIFSILYVLTVSWLNFPVTTILKPVPIFCLMMIAGRAFLPMRPKRLLLLALLFSLLGDVALTIPLKIQLELGLTFFLIAHLSYIVLFSIGIRSIRTRRRISLVLMNIYILILFFVGSFFYILMPHLGDMLIPVVLYMVIITCMVFCAMVLNPVTAMGAALFLISDSILAFNEFIDKDFNGTVWIMLSYYLAQWFIVMGTIHFFQRESFPETAVNNGINNP